MRRRAFLASTLSATTAALAGCSALQRRTEHSDPTVFPDDNPRDDGKYIEFSEDGRELATLGVDPAFDPQPRTLHTSISHTQDTELRSLTQRIVAPDGDVSPPELSLQGPFMGDHEPHPAVSLYRDGRAAVVEVHRFGEIADETVFMTLSVTDWPSDKPRLVVGNTVELVEPGLPDRTHVLEGQLTFE
jgi:hypothetical protein